MFMVRYKNPKEIIVKALMKHPEGLTIQQIADAIKTTRITATKYIHELIGEGMVYQRKVGIAKLCYLKKRYLRDLKEEEVIEKLREKLAKKKL